MVPKTAVEPTTPKRPLQDGIDGLWKLQLRREHTALLERQEANAKFLQSLAAEATKNKKDYEERMAALETTVLNLQSDERKDRHAFEKWGEELATLKAQMGGVLNTLNQYEQEFSGVAAPGRAKSSPRSGSTDKPNVPNTTPRTNGLTTSTSSEQVPATAKTSNYFPAQTKASLTNAGLHPTSRDVEITTSFAGPVTRSRSRKRSRSQSGEAFAPISSLAQAKVAAPAARPSAQASVPAPAPAPTLPTPAAQLTKIPRLYQGTGPLKAYLDKATATFDSLPGIKDKKFEIGFVASFVKGIREDDYREILVAELQQQHQSRTKKDGKVEILCRWKDVGEGMKRADLIKVADANAGPKGKQIDRLLRELMD